jgi:hypothetical protein
MNLEGLDKCKKRFFNKYRIINFLILIKVLVEFSSCNSGFYFVYRNI